MQFFQLDYYRRLAYMFSCQEGTPPDKIPKWPLAYWLRYNTMNNENVAIIAFLAGEGVGRKRTEETQRKAFDDLAAAFEDRFERAPTESDWALWCDHLASEAQAKIDAAQRKLQRQAAKRAKLEAMPFAGGIDSASDAIATYGKGKYLLTCAQNNTIVDDVAIGSLLQYAERNACRLLIGKTLYNTKAYRQQPSLDPEQNDNDDGAIWFDEKVKPFLVEGHIDLGGAHFLADANILPTTKWPTSGIDGMTPSGIDAIVPATKIELRVGAALQGANTKRLVATGTVTKRNYIMRKAGAIAAFSHSIGALFIDTTGDIPVLRHLEVMEGQGGFYDLDGFYTPKGFVQGAKVAAFQAGDLHAEKLDPNNLDRVLQFIDELEPEHFIAHDVLDFSSRNHHNIKDPLFIHRQTVEGHTVEGDLTAVATCLDEIAWAMGQHGGKVHIVESNHDLAIETWVKNADWKADPINAQTYLTIALEAVKANESRSHFNMLEFAYKEIGGGSYSSDDIHFHLTDESLVIAGIENGNHGHNGPNGARGNPKSFANLGVPMNTGHTHSPSIYGGCYTSGVTASLQMGYNKGPSSWAIAHIVTYENGQRQILFA